MNIGGALASSLIRVVVVVATLAAVYYFIVRPVLDTTEKVSGGISGSLEKSLDDAFRQTGISQQKRTVITREIRSVPQGKMRRLERCVTRAGADFGRIQRCAARFSP